MPDGQGGFKMKTEKIPAPRSLGDDQGAVATGGAATHPSGSKWTTPEHGGARVRDRSRLAQPPTPTRFLRKRRP